MVVPPTFSPGPGTRMQMIDSNDSKSTLRKLTRVARNQFFENLDANIAAIAFSAPPSPLRKIFENKPNVSGYWPVSSEASPRALLKFAHLAGCKTALPFIAHKSAPMQFCSWTEADRLEAGVFGMQQPEPTKSSITPDVVLLPLIAFDRNGGRIGQGGGHYDRALSLLPNALKIGIAWSVQEVDDTHPDPWDIPLNIILTEREWIEI